MKGVLSPLPAILTGQAASALVKRARGVLAVKGPGAPIREVHPRAAYWRAVYAMVEQLWQRLTPAERSAWGARIQECGVSARDIFGRVNMGQVGRFDSWLRLPPASLPWVSRQESFPGSVAIPPEIKGAFPAWADRYAPLIWVSSESRSGYVEDVTDPYAGWAEAWRLCLADPWTPSTYERAYNFSRIDAHGGYYDIMAYQSRTIWLCPKLLDCAWRCARVRWFCFSPGCPPGYGDWQDSMMIFPGRSGYYVTALGGMIGPGAEKLLSVNDVDWDRVWPIVPITGGVQGWQVYAPMLYWQGRGD